MGEDDINVDEIEQSEDSDEESEFIMLESDSQL